MNAVPASFSRADAAARTADCLSYAADAARISGRLERHTFYGPPNFGEDPKRDQRETGFYLDLRAPVCTGAAPGEESKTGVKRVQLILDEEGYARLRPYLGREIALRGTLLAASTGHHHAPLLLRVAEPVQAEQ